MKQPEAHTVAAMLVNVGMKLMPANGMGGPGRDDALATGLTSGGRTWACGLSLRKGILTHALVSLRAHPGYHAKDCSVGARIAQHASKARVLTITLYASFGATSCQC